MSDAIEKILESHQTHFLKMLAMMQTGGMKTLSQGRDTTETTIKEIGSLLENLEKTLKKRKLDNA